MSDLAFAVGLFAGEGSIGSQDSQNNGRRYTYLNLQIGMYDERSIARFAAVFGINYQGIKLPHRKDRPVSGDGQRSYGSSHAEDDVVLAGAYRQGRPGQGSTQAIESQTRGVGAIRVNVYAEEMTDRVEIVEKQGFTGLRIFLALPASFVPDGMGRTAPGRPATAADSEQATQYQAPFIHRPGDDDSSAVTFWGKRDLRVVLRKALEELDRHYEGPERRRSRVSFMPGPGDNPGG